MYIGGGHTPDTHMASTRSRTHTRTAAKATAKPKSIFIYNLRKCQRRMAAGCTNFAIYLKL